MRPRLAVVALGCRVSRADADALAAELGGALALAREGERADVVVVNGCAVTCDAESTARQAIRRASREHPGARIVAAGCSAQVRGGALAALPGVAAVVGPRAREGVAAVVARIAGVPGPSAPGPVPEAGAVAVAGPARHTRPFLKIQDGCDRRCAFCIVPAARGPSRSLAPDEALRRLAALGERHPEVVLTGVHLGGWGRDLSPRTSLVALVREAARRQLVRRLRLSSLDAAEVPLGLVREPDARAILCEHFHVPLQSGSARVLRAVRRPASPGRFRRVVEELACAVPGACLGTDVIAGLPGEIDADHRETVALLSSLPLAYLHVFPFSPRPGTAAAEMPGAVPAPVARERARELRALSARMWRAHLAAQVGRELEVVVERPEDGFERGTARSYVTVRWPASGEGRGSLARVRVIAVDGEECVGVRL
ncbi:MAG TPA: MiaB/RimO family radical SAM methylthiotransferase [Anaeromyxobacter sp.]|nr:MiaB/RimO family radical SAM methylthiotransferase [Anaeromyxobacter sp.]